MDILKIAYFTTQNIRSYVYIKEIIESFQLHSNKNTAFINKLYTKQTCTK